MVWEIIKDFALSTGIAKFFEADNVLNLIMIGIACLLLYLAIFKEAEPYLLIPIAFGMLLVNLPDSDVFVKSTSVYYDAAGFAKLANIDKSVAERIFDLMAQVKDYESLDGQFKLYDILMYLDKTEVTAQEFISLFGITDGTSAVSALFNDGKMAIADVLNTISLEYSTTYIDVNGAINNYEILALSGQLEQLADPSYSGLLGTLYYGVKFEIYPCLIFLGIGATTDFGPLIANPKSMLLGAAAQIGIFVTLIGALALGFTDPEAASIGIIGGADGPTAILTTTKLADHLLPAISVAAYSYMALVPFIQPPIIRLFTTKEERQIKMGQLREVKKVEKIIFPILVSIVVIILIPSCAPLVGMLMLGNLIKESGVVPKLVETASNAILYTVTIVLGLCVGATATADNFLSLETLKIFGLGIVAFSIATAGGVLIGKLMCKLSKGTINPMIGAAGVSAVPMAARVVHKEGVKEDPTNFLLMHAMGPNVAGVIGSAIAAGLLINMFQ